MVFRWGYALATAAVFCIELAIAIFLNDPLIRPHVGDALAVILVYLGLRTILPWRPLPAALTALGVAFAIELGQLFHIRDLLDLSDSALVRFTLGGVFDVKDLVFYTAGAILALVVEAARRERIA
ncbi:MULTISPECIES: DUF2809 domain-containing protein [Asticcacaulis]|uniref:ribosomal maturation YjgA family protein n=1 Tax=Asticcacaulis TaxID=76890 RepID=UPI001AE5CCD8|nr:MULTISPECIES: DUF2809 domain-containing protein [Asticcacaulis]MBP2157556.1 hypothetical protein [Asticcacaulis solisilvae]MDR6798601.1 hypothetical protein [Asticcacaulis sp. BE141]